MKKLFLSTLLLALPLLASAYDIAVKNADGVTIYYNYINNGTELEVTREYYYASVINIPEEVTYMSRTRKVTSIGKQAFYYSGLTSVNIPNSVTSIGEAAFHGCTGLTSVSIPNSVTSIGDGAFHGCTGLTSVSIPNSVTSIGGLAFSKCSGLTSVTIPNSVTTIGEGAFAGCSGLTSVHITDLAAWCNISFWGYSSNPLQYAPHLFLNGEEIKDLVIPNSVTSIGKLAFYNCSGLTSVTIPNSVISIGEDAFAGCSGLTSVHITDLAAWCNISFWGYSSNPLQYAPHLFLNGEEIKDLVIPNSVTSIGKLAFYDCSGLTSITIPNSVTSIGDYAFLGCYGLTSVTIPNSVTSIGLYAFEGCSGLTSVTIPNSVTSIGNGAFSGCRSLTSVTIPNSVTSIENQAFMYCNNLTSVISKMEYPCTIDNYCFPDDVFKKSTLYIPKGTMDRYKMKDFWNKFLHIIEGSPFEHKLTYLVDGETYSTYTLEEGDVIAPEEAPTKEGYTFSGWSAIPETMPASDVTITGTFTINKYKLTYMVDGVEYKSSELEFGTTITPEAFPTNEGQTFSGWSEIPETMPASDLTITGTFTVNKYKLTYKVDGEEYKSSEVEFGSTITAEEKPTKEGYTFSGWSDIPSTMPANDVTITGTFTINKYKLTYMLDGEEYKSSEVEFGSTITSEDNPTKEGYTFSGWSDIPSTMPANDVTVTGTFTINKYKLTYMVDGVEYKSSEVEFGTTITPEAFPANEGQTFSGWSEIPETMPAHDVIITGTFSDNSYKLTYMVDGEVFKSSHVEFGSAITPETPPTKEGYTFSGWSEIPETMPAGDVTVTGTFTINTYTITYMVDNALLTTEEVTYGSTITPPASPMEGYEITWNSHPTTMPAYDITIYGSYIATGINGLYAEESDKKVYTPDGKRIQSPKKGMNIIRMSDGTVKKVVVK